MNPPTKISGLSKLMCFGNLRSKFKNTNLDRKEFSNCKTIIIVCITNLLLFGDKCSGKPVDISKNKRVTTDLKKRI
jgi:hypothetical protein